MVKRVRESILKGLIDLMMFVGGRRTIIDEGDALIR